MARATQVGPTPAEPGTIGTRAKWVARYDEIEYELSVTLEEITPLDAARYLDRNFAGNRKRSHVRSKRYANVMRRRRWRVTHEGIAFDEHNELIDGQHRLQAVIESGEPILAFVFRGLPLDVYEALGRPMLRRIDDAATEEWITSRTVAIGRVMLLGVRAGSGIDVAGLDEDALLTGIRRHREALQFVEGRHHNKRVTAPVLGAVTRAWHSVDRERLGEFLDVLQSNEPQHAREDQPALRLYRHITADTPGANSYKARADLYRVTETAVRAFLDRKPVDRLAPAATELFPLPE